MSSASSASSFTAAGQGRTSTTSAAAGAAVGSAAALRSTGAYRPAQQPQYFAGLPSSASLALDYGAFIVPVEGAARGLRGIGTLGRGGLAAETDILSLLGFPSFLREGRASAAGRPGEALTGVESVLGEQATIGNLPEGGGLSFGELPLLALGLVLLASLLLVGATAPPGVVAHTRVSATRFASARQPLALAAIGILVPVAAVALFVALR